MSQQNNETDFLARWLEGELSDEEKRNFESSDDFLAFNEIIRGAEKLRKPNYSFNIDTEFEKQLAYNKHYNTKKTKVVKLFPWKYIAAASVLLIAAIGLIFSLNSTVSVQTVAAEKVVHQLPDQSVVTLNAISAIEYDKKSFLNKRELDLTGQAFFEVAKGQSFTVKTNKGSITVLGTKFDVLARQNNFEVICYEGKVRVSNPSGKTVILTKGNAVRLTTDNNLAAFDVKRNTPDWKQDFSAFTNAPIARVINELERQYAITIKSNQIDTQRFFTGFFTHKDLQSAIKTCFQPLNIKYTFVKPDEIILKE
ncbi:FecR family protein [Aquimarina agarivorans]|uniref:FecR family protein n=1 Tax=Aquimarina agarivorans TaxID=980584 RepID=UPI000248F024|nr:FecR domain-containing protein [Aquimarina agarivorans]